MSTARPNRDADWLDLIGFAGEEDWLIAALWTAANIHANAGRYADATAIFEGLERLLPDHPIGLIGQAEIANTQRRVGDLSRLAKRAAEKPGASRAHLSHALTLAANAAESRGRLREARELLERARRVAPESSKNLVQQTLARLEDKISEQTRRQSAAASTKEQP